jgi:hypothetical protein
VRLKLVFRENAGAEFAKYLSSGNNANYCKFVSVVAGAKPAFRILLSQGCQMEERMHRIHVTLDLGRHNK